MTDPFWQDEKRGLYLYYGDSIPLMDCLRDRGRQFQAAITDPPYNRAVDYADRDDAMPADEYEWWCRNWFWRTGALSDTRVFTCGVQNVGMWERIEQPTWWLAWDTTNRLMKRTPLGYSRWEPLAVYGQAITPIPDIFRAPIISSEHAGDHPCPKPLSWGLWLVERFAGVGQAVLDPFAGTGTVLRACAMLGRECVSVELSESYCEKIAETMEADTAQGVLFEAREVVAERTLGVEFVGEER